MTWQLCMDCSALVDPTCMSCPECGSLNLHDHPDFDSIDDVGNPIDSFFDEDDPYFVGADDDDDDVYDYLGVCEVCGDRYVRHPETVCHVCATQAQIDRGVGL
jgi:hypothetical protein